jgi:hypothetical protein
MSTLTHEEEVAMLDRTIARLQQQASADALELEQAHTERDAAREELERLKAAMTDADPAKPGIPRVEAICPHPECGASIPVKVDLPAGEYKCRCHAFIVRLEWATYLEGDNRPYLTLVGKAGKEPTK